MTFLFVLLALSQTPDILIADFEGPTYGPGWVATGEAFGTGPAHGTLPGQMQVGGFKGQGLVNSFLHGDPSTGTLTSPEFKIERDYLSFLIGGGMDREKLSVHLLIDGKPVRTATGNNDRPGGSETLLPAHWDLRDLRGKTAQLQILDRATGGWGHINVDQIVQTNTEPPHLLTDVHRELTAQKRYLHLPIKNGAAKRKVTLLVEGKPVVVNDIELADDTPDWWAPLEVSAWKGKTLQLQVDSLLSDSKALSSIEQSDTLKGAENLYHEPLRSQFHFSPRHGWTNDPNGLVFYNGEYHLFFQHNPYGVQWGNMHWGHATSRDLMRWQEHGDVLAPDTLGPMFSGSAVVDWKNTSGFGKDGKAPLVLIYTAAGNPTTQCLAYSNDGRTFTKYEKNPVIPQVTGGNRDPKVFWHETTQKWVQVLYVEKDATHTIHFFTSPNLRDWTLASVAKGDPTGKRFLFECPDFFELPVQGAKNQRKWVLTAADSQYALGSFNGTTFTPDQGPLPGQLGRGFYAAQTFSDIPTKDGRRIQIGWMQAESPGMSFNQAMTIPLELGLLATPDGPRMTRTPIRELATLRRQSRYLSKRVLTPETPNPLSGRTGEHVELEVEFEPGTSQEVTVTVRGATITYDVQKQELVVNGQRAAAPLRNGKQKVHVFCDRTVLEVFASDGLCYVPLPFIPELKNHALTVSVKGGSATLHRLALHELQSTWPAP